MHVCLATHEFPPVVTGGISTYYANLAAILSEHGHRVTVLTLGSGEEEETSSGVQVVRLGQPHERHLRQIEGVFPPELRPVAPTVANGLAMRDWLRSNGDRLGIDVVETIEYLGAAAFLLENDLPPVLVTCHGSIGQVKNYSGVPLVEPQHGLFASLEAIALSLSDEVGCYSPQNAEDWTEFLGRAPRFMRAPVLIGPRRERRIRESESLQGVVLARLNNWKGIFELVEALKRCLSKGLDIKIRWIGRDQRAGTEGIPSIKRYLETDHGDLWGNAFLWEESLSREDANRALSEADFALVPSRWDTFNFTAAEALEAGTPLIITKGAGANYLCEHGVSALIAAPSDSESLTEAMIQIQDPDLRRKLSAGGRLAVEREFAVERVLEERLQGYEAAIERHDYRRDHPYVLSMMNPLVRHWLRGDDIESASATAARLPSRLIVAEALRRIRRFLRRR